MLYKAPPPSVNVRNELWYPRYHSTNTKTLNNLFRKNRDVEVKMLGIQGDLDFGLRTRYEFTALQVRPPGQLSYTKPILSRFLLGPPCAAAGRRGRRPVAITGAITGAIAAATTTMYFALQEDINMGVEKSLIKVRPLWVQIPLDDLAEELAWAEKKEGRVVMICSCPSRLGDNRDVVRQVYDACEGKANVEITFSEAGDASSAIFESMAVPDAHPGAAGATGPLRWLGGLFGGGGGGGSTASASGQNKVGAAA